MKNGFAPFIMSKKVDEKWFGKVVRKMVDDKWLMKEEKMVGQIEKMFSPKSASRKTTFSKIGIRN